MNDIKRERNRILLERIADEKEWKRCCNIPEPAEYLSTMISRSRYLDTYRCQSCRGIIYIERSKR